MMSLQDAIERLQTHARATTGIQAAPDNVDLTVGNNDIWALSYAKSGQFGMEAAAQGHDLHNLITLISIQGAEIVSVEKRAEGILEVYVNKLRNDLTLNGTVSAIVFPITYEASREVAQNKTTLLFEITIPVKIRGAF